MSPQKAIRISLGLAVLLGGLAFFLLRSSTPVKLDARALAGILDDAQLAIEDEDWPRLTVLLSEIPPGQPELPESLLTLGELAVRMKHHNEAVQLFDKIPRDESEPSIKARVASAGIHFHQGHLQKAVDDFEFALKYYPNQVQILNTYSLLLDFSNQRFKSSQILFDLVRNDAFSPRHLLFLANPATVHEPAAELKRSEPDEHDAIINLANARYLILQDHLDQGERFLRRALEIRPDFQEALVRVGEVALLKNDINGFAKWYNTATDEVKKHPAFWQISGQWAEQHKDNRGAARCYWECLRRDPNVRIANYRLGQLLPTLGIPVPSEPFLSYSAAITDLSIAVDVLFNNQEHIPSMKAAATATEKMGRYWEAVGWARSALVVDPSEVWARELIDRCGRQLRPDSPRNDPDLNPAANVNLESIPIPRFDLNPSSGGHQLTGGSDSTIQFSDDTTALGIDFAYFNGPDPTTASGRMFEFTGGGVAALDFDRDGAIDLYFSQGCEWPPEAGNGKHLDRLYRNRGDQFQDVTARAQLFEERFGQGANAGDFDQDGFPDVYVANTHVNRLWKNMGDGTFEDSSNEAGLTSSEWTTSCLMADLNGDTFPDIVDVNYATGDELFIRICESNGIARSCSPLAFKACDDRLLMNTGDGHFRDVTQETGFELGDGRGLGIVAFSPGNHASRPSLFVANDMTANFFFQNETMSPGVPPKLNEAGILTGVAFDVDGASQASMGVATADVDRNGLLDIFVTNFYNEANNMYLQQPEGGFIDAAATTGLRNPGYSMLGFGTQFLDANLDGWSDLFVTNGHVDDFRHDGIPYQMRSQFFVNQGDAKFVEQRAGTLGPFFDREMLGRAVTKFDWNRDRKEDLAITFLDDPVVVLTNRSHTSNRSVAIELCGTTVDREAIGSIVTIETEGQHLVSQVTGGDGYMASNQRRLVFGLKDATKIDRVEVQWTDGTKSVFVGLPADANYIIRQGSETGPFSVP